MSSIPQSSERTTILVVDDEDSIRISLQLALKTRYNVLTARNSAEAFERIRTSPVKLAIVDIKMSSDDGLDLLKEIKAHDPLIEVIILTGFTKTEFVMTAMDREAAFFHQKPFELPLLTTQIERALKFRATNEATVAALQRQDEESEMIAIQNGIVHDMRNTLTVALGHCEVLHSRMSSMTQLSHAELFSATKDLEIVLNNIRLTVVLTSRHMRIVRAASGAVDSPTDDVASLIHDLAESLGSHPGLHGARFTCKCLPEKLPAIEMPLMDLFQILLNLCVNAAQAGASRAAVAVEARSRIEPIDLAPLADSPNRRVIGADRFPNRGPVVVVTVSDSGAGIPPEVLAKLFRTQVTTKPQGVGTGIGLHSVGKLIARNKALLTLDTAVGQGTSISLYLPLRGLAQDTAIDAKGSQKSA